MSSDEDKIVNYCVYCGEKLEKNQVYCPNCGKLVVKAKTQKIEKPRQRTEGKDKAPSRTCPGCGSIITSPILEQCPICKTKLEKLPPSKKVEPKKESGLIFKNKKLELEDQHKFQKGSWTLKEGFNVFWNSLLIYITARLLLYIGLFFIDPNETLVMSANIYTILLSQVPEMLFGAYPLYYITSRRYHFTKLGFDPSSQKLAIAILIGVGGTIGLYVVGLFSDIFIDFLYDIGIRFIDINQYIAEENAIIANANFLNLVFLIIALSIATTSSEIVFRGVLHNSLKEKFGKDLNGKFTTIIVVALAYSGIFLLFTIPIGIYFFAMNLLVSLVLGIIYEINQNIYNTIITNIIYNIFIVILIVFF